MNNFGAVASNDTLQRHIETVSISRLQKGLTYGLDLNALAIVSVDNIDFLQSHAFVYSGDVSRSWHGTTIQVVQLGLGDYGIIDYWQFIQEMITINRLIGTLT